jgi:hypothetical protein
MLNTSYWQKHTDFPIIVRKIDIRFLAFHVGTGQTHLLNLEAYNVLSYLNKTLAAQSVEDILTILIEQNPAYAKSDLHKLLNTL